MSHASSADRTPMLLDLPDYRAWVALDAPFDPPHPASADEADRLVERLVEDLLRDTRLAAQLDRRVSPVRAPRSPRALLQALLTVRPPEPFLPASFHEQVDRVLQFERALQPVREAVGLPTVADAFPGARLGSAASLSLWQGDITCLRADAIVNAANDALLGCFEPFHACIDNAIHSAAGPRLREDCWRIMSRQGAPEPTGHAKITRGYHLPARFVLHTVGPIISGSIRAPASADQIALGDCYRACLDVASQIAGIRTLAFPCISTGVFGYPQAEAARIAVDAVDGWLAAHPGRLDRVVFNVFRARDLAIYADLFTATTP